MEVGSKERKDNKRYATHFKRTPECHKTIGGRRGESAMTKE